MGSSGMFAYRGRAVWIIAALGLLMLLPSAAAAADEPCNGAPELCDRPLDQVVLPGTHNSMSAAELNWSLPNQTYSISNQLKLGVRALLFDTHYGEANGNGTVIKIPKSEGRVTHAHTYMCHELCQLGSVDLTEELGRIADFLAANPREVLTFINQDGISPEDYATAVQNSGLLPYVYQGSATSFPTLRQMIDSGQRVVMLAEQEAAGVSWYHLAYDGSVMETPYEFIEPVEGNSTAKLTDPAQLNESCRPNRGQEGSPLFLMNHWITTSVTPQPARAAIVNTKEALVARAKACEARRGKLPNIVAVDFFGQGDLIGAVRQLNGVEKPILTVSKPKPRTAKSKRKATFRVKVSNAGDADATSVKVCATVPSRLAKKPRCSTIASVPIDTTGTASLSFKTKKRFRKGTGTVRFSISSSQPTIKTTAKLTVKPLKKPKRHK
ncbi:MAG: hypothetical protein JJE13_12270 [Thermoleophilia bacterium]|nr:hypothetical protein [Thermoleophilia bacterium]